MRFIAGFVISALSTVFATMPNRGDIGSMYDVILANSHVTLSPGEAAVHKANFVARIKSGAPGRVLDHFQNTMPVVRSSIVNFVNTKHSHINKSTGLPESLWEAGDSDRFHMVSHDDAKVLCGTVIGTFDSHHEMPTFVPESAEEAKALPPNFDARTKFGICAGSIGNIPDQGQCGDCWAVSSAAAFSDRQCIVNGGAIQTQMSAEHTMSCAGADHGFQSQGCDGGYPADAFGFYTQFGVVSGDEDPNSPDTCWPYDSPTSTPVCDESQCPDPYFQGTFDSDRHFGTSVVNIPAVINSIKTEIFNNGPIVAGFIVYEDFMSYKRGIYHHITGQQMGGHAVKVIGWGSQSGVNYWLVANSWGPTWGESGFFRIKMGDCQFEQMMSSVIVSAQSFGELL